MNRSNVNFVDYFSEVSDPRRETKNKLHKLKEILVLVILAVICGADNWTEIEAFGKLSLSF